MPNWCYTHYTFDGNTSDVVDFYHKLDEWTSEEHIKNGFGYGWLGNVVSKAGFGKFMAPNCPDKLRMRCRGSVTDISEVNRIDENSSSFGVWVESAWYATPKIFFAIIDKYHYDISVAYQVEEGGNEIYQIYDPDNLGCYDDESLYLDLCVDMNDEDLEEYPVLKELLDGGTYWNSGAFLEYIKQYGFESVEDFNEYFYQNLSDDDFVVAHKFEYIDEVYE